MTRPTTLEIDLTAITHNLQRVKTLAPGSRILAMVKADAYGHGLETVIDALADTDAFGVSCLEEALVIRQHNQTTPIVLLEGVFCAAEMADVMEKHLDIVVHRLEQIDWLASLTSDQTIRVWLKINTGMQRLGIEPEQARAAWERLTHCAAVSDDIILMTHFSDADDPTNPKTRQQQQQFLRSIDFAAAPQSLANSAAILAFPETQADWVRPGIMLYGISPFSDRYARDWQLQAAMTLSAEVISIRQCQPGDTVGYGSTWTCPEAMPIAVIAIGYGDGYPRHAKSGTPVLINGRVAPLVGAVSMDMITVDLRGHSQVQVGDRAILWGPDNPIETIAEHADTIAYELVCHMTKRLNRVYRTTDRAIT